MTELRPVGMILSRAIHKGLVRKEDTAMIFYDLEFLKSRINRLETSFPAGALHALAIKANPLRKVLEFTRKISPSTGVEAATIGEVHLALNAGFSSERIVYDSPVKTLEELHFALSNGIHINADNLSEIERIASILSDNPSIKHHQSPSVAIRINPQVGIGTIAESSVAGEYSKFGVPLNTRRTELMNLLMTTPWINGVHLHVGSQGCAPSMLVEGIGRLYDLAMEVNVHRQNNGLRPLSVFDIGGGLPVSYRSDAVPPAIEEYVAAIRHRAPALFTSDRGTGPEFRMVTEFGRWVYTNAGWTVSRVEYVKHDQELVTLMLHVGADLFVRECLNPQDWQHEYSLYDKAGNLKSGGDLYRCNLAGPLCFAGDIIARHVMLPKAEPGDYLVIHDTGSYTFSMWSRYNSRLTPRIAGYHGNEFVILKERETVEEMGRFWE